MFTLAVFGWSMSKTIIFLIPFALVLLGAIVWLLVRGTIRSRFRMNAQFQADPDINDWLVLFNWSRKVIYMPTIIVSLVAFVIVLLQEHHVLGTAFHGNLMGGIWLGVFFINFLIDEYEVNLKVVFIAILLLLVAGLWLHLMDWLVDFLEMFKRLDVALSSTAYLMFALIMLLGVAMSWLRGLFYYVSITPNYMNVQSGPTETGQQVSREEYSTRVDTGDFLERLLGFGRIIITFKDVHRPPMVLLVSGIGKRARKLESIRGILAVERVDTKDGKSGL